MCDNWETFISFLFRFLLSQKSLVETEHQIALILFSHSSLSSSASSVLIVVHKEVVGGHRAAPHTLHSSTLMPGFVHSSRGGFFPLLWWPVIK